MLKQFTAGKSCIHPPSRYEFIGPDGEEVCPIRSQADLDMAISMILNVNDDYDDGYQVREYTPTSKMFFEGGERKTLNYERMRTLTSYEYFRG